MSKKLTKILKRSIVPTEENNFHPRLFQVEILTLFLVLVLIIQAFIYSGANRSILKLFPSLSNIASVLPAILAQETNEYRENEHVKPLQESALLNKAAELKANDMAKRGYFSHLDPDGEKPWKWLKEVGYEYTYAGENLAIDFIDSKDVTDAWIASITHRANLINTNFTEVGLGVTDGVYEDKPTTFVVQFFATPASDPVLAPKVSPEVLPKPDFKVVIEPVVATKISSSLSSKLLTSTSTAESGQVLGLTTSIASFESTSSMSTSATSIGKIAYSSKTIFIRLVRLIVGFLVLIVLVSFTHSILTHPIKEIENQEVKKPSIVDRLRYAYRCHKKVFVSLLSFVLIFLIMLIIGMYVFNSPVRI